MRSYCSGQSYKLHETTGDKINIESQNFDGTQSSKSDRLELRAALYPDLFILRAEFDAQELGESQQAYSHPMPVLEVPSDSLRCKLLLSNVGTGHAGFSACQPPGELGGRLDACCSFASNDQVSELVLQRVEIC